MDTTRSIAVGYLNFAGSYLDTAQHVVRSTESGNLRLAFDAPVFALLAHALELQRKLALIARGMPTSEVSKFKPNISRLYATCKENPEGNVSIADVEMKVRNRWQTHLRSARDAHQNEVSEWIGSDDPQAFKEFKVSE